MFNKSTKMFKTGIAAIALISMLIPVHSHAQICRADIITTAPDSRYELLNSGAEVKDKQTGLIWQRCNLGQTWDGSNCKGLTTTHSWKRAVEKASALGNGYRLPNIKELQTLAELACSRPAINGTIFPYTQTSAYWSASNADSNTAWYVYFYDGSTGYKNKDYAYYVRAVRTSQ